MMIKKNEREYHAWFFRIIAASRENREKERFFMETLGMEDCPSYDKQMRRLAAAYICVRLHAPVSKMVKIAGISESSL